VIADKTAGLYRPGRRPTAIAPVTHAASPQGRLNAITRRFIAKAPLGGGAELHKSKEILVSL
jgi:hypothetical protein